MYNIFKIDALEGHVQRLQALLRKSDREMGDLRQELGVKTKALRHAELIHEQSLKKLMEMQRKSMQRGAEQMARERAEEEERAMRRASTPSFFARRRSSSGLGSPLSSSRSSSDSATPSGNMRKVRKPLRGGGGKRTSPRVSHTLPRTRPTALLEATDKSATIDGVPSHQQQTSVIESAQLKLEAGLISREEFNLVVGNDATFQLAEGGVAVAAEEGGGGGEEEEDEDEEQGRGRRESEGWL